MIPTPRLPALRPTVVAALVPLLMLGPACSALFVNGPPPQPEKKKYFDCTSSNAAPVLDAIVGGYTGLMAIESYSASQGAYSDTRSTDYMLPVLAFAGALGASAIWGFTKTSECREAKNELEARQDGYGDEGSRGSYAPMPATRGRPAVAPSPWELPPPGWRPRKAGAPAEGADSPPGAADAPGGHADSPATDDEPARGDAGAPGAHPDGGTNG